MLLALAPAPAGAQIRIGVPAKSQKPKLLKFKGEVVAANAQQIVVRSSENDRMIRTFSFTDDVRKQMEKIVEKGGYQPGDKVEIQHEPGADVAVKIKGKPSKAQTTR
jgi:hypothetical protein